MKNPFLLLTLVTIAFSGCATYASKDHVVVYSNCDYVKWKGGEKPTLEMWRVNNSEPTRVGLDGITKAGAGIGMALLTKGVGSGIGKVAK